MSWLLVLIALIVAVLIIGFLLRMLKGAVKLVATLFVIAVLVGGALWIFNDMNDLRKHFYQDDKMFLLEIDSEIAGGFRLGATGIPVPLSGVRGLDGRLDEWGFEDEYYKVIVITWPVVAKDVQLAGFSATASELRQALLSEHPKHLFIDKGTASLGIRARDQLKLQADTLYPNEDAFAGTVFALLAEKPLSNPDLMFKGMKEGTVRVYPETITFKILKILPDSFNKLLAPAPE
jgi:hypothetical protein